MFNSSHDLVVWPDNTQCYHYELHEMTNMSDDYIVIPAGSLHYPDGITIHEVDYDAVVKQRKAYVEDLRVKLSDKGE